MRNAWSFRRRSHACRARRNGRGPGAVTAFFDRPSAVGVLYPLTPERVSIISSILFGFACRVFPAAPGGPFPVGQYTLFRAFGRARLVARFDMNVNIGVGEELPYIVGNYLGDFM